MFSGYAFTVEERFIRYAKIDTTSDPHSETFPSTEKQKDLSRLLVEELLTIGLSDAYMDDNGYVYATIPSNTDKKVPVICFCAHVDTSSDSSGTGVKPIVHRKYNGAPIVLPDDPSQVIRVEDHPYLNEKIGEDIITASGTTLLGADDKAGVAVIMDMTNYLVSHPEVKHGDIRILFTPDEEVGRGVDKLDMKTLGADFGYTLDGSERGSFEDESFSADAATVIFHGISAHPGYAKGKLVNAIKVAATFVDSLPRNEFSPETTADRQGFVHPVHVDGTAEMAKVDFIVRDFETVQLNAHVEKLDNLARKAVEKYPGSRYEIKQREQYRNMNEVLNQHPQVASFAEEAIRRAGMEVRKFPIRCGTDGSRLSFMGLPCPNIFTGEMAFHSKHEYVSVQDMQKAVETIVYLAMIWEERS
ncbi:MAG TPA: peptidase T [Chitinophagaceae bacterium]|nr:peptidase T [Chitinophagaceae bacterium]